VVVVGLGAFGSAITRHLAEGGAKVIGIDRFHPPHPYGSSHGETRITRLAIGEGDVYVPIVRRSHELWRELEATAGASLMKTTGGLVIASKASGDLPYHGQLGFFEQTLGAAKRFGIAHELLYAAEIRRRFSGVPGRGRRTRLLGKRRGHSVSGAVRRGATRHGRLSRR
jgi:sarcosine oxidase